MAETADLTLYHLLRSSGDAAFATVLDAALEKARTGEQSLEAVLRDTSEVSEELLEAALEERAARSRRCSACEEETFLLPGQHVSYAKCEHCEESLVPLEGEVDPDAPTPRERVLRASQGPLIRSGAPVAPRLIEEDLSLAVEDKLKRFTLGVLILAGLLGVAALSCLVFVKLLPRSRIQWIATEGKAKRLARENDGFVVYVFIPRAADPESRTSDVHAAEVLADEFMKRTLTDKSVIELANTSSRFVFHAVHKKLHSSREGKRTIPPDPGGLPYIEIADADGKVFVPSDNDASGLRPWQIHVGRRYRIPAELVALLESVRHEDLIVRPEPEPEKTEEQENTAKSPKTLKTRPPPSDKKS